MNEAAQTVPAIKEAADPPSAAVLDLTADRISCLACGGKLLGSEAYRRLLVCPACRFHYNMPARKRINSLADTGTFRETNPWIKSLDPLSFSPRVPYSVRLQRDTLRTGLSEAAVTGVCTIGGTQSVLIVLDFGFLGGSMGLVVGEKVALALETAVRRKCPVVTVITSGGARIQEGVLSLMQMAKTSVAVNALHEKGLPLISVLGNPSTGQAYASFASLSDLLIAEPGAHIGFAPFRAVQKAIERRLAAEQYTSERYLEHGLIDYVTDREQLKNTLAVTLELLSPEFRLKLKQRPRQPVYKVTPLEPWEMVRLARHPDRPRARDHIRHLFPEFLEIHGDGVYGDDPSVIAGFGRLGGQSVVVIGQQNERPQPDSGSDGASGPSPGRIAPEGFRKARRALMLAARYRFPVVTLVDTPGPQLDLDAERRGLANAIAGTISAFAEAPVPVISVLIGEGGSEAALAFGVADRILMLQNAIYTPISPEGGAQAELGDASRAEELARALKLTSSDCLQMGVVDAIVPEPEGGAHVAPEEAARLVRRSLVLEMATLQGTRPSALVKRRQQKFRRIGEYGQSYRESMRKEARILQAAFLATVKALRRGSAADDET
ncbi:MAG: acetyl-CoA carboxylase carboxyl transferase subunit beta, partial [Chloroflexi bacterium]|nr:acetyl-CoA carboxylase carboxyl transferase subunit beta [Chloroflexota bacterium]